MVKIKKLQSTKITSIPGGKDPLLLIEEFLTQRGYQPKSCLQFKSNEVVTWSVPINEEDELEITLEKLNQHTQTTIYFGINIFAVPLKYTEAFLASALIVADSLIGTKISLIDYDLVLSVTHYVYNMTIEDLNYFFELLLSQQEPIKSAILEGMKLDF
ncbi:MAG: hypothetical protein LBE20_01930 [Deltaproteobacteria bacterium]|jgi:hypothetical protein|nr:hypothetical protein [Deltaproteobacteria bacterium]